MSSEKKLWPNFRRSLGITVQVLQPDPEARRTQPQSGGFVIVPEFDKPDQTTSVAQLSESRHSSQHFRSLLAEAPSSPLSQNDVDGYFPELDAGTSGSGSSPSHCPCSSENLHDVSAKVADTPHWHTHGAGQDLDFEQRLGSAYAYIRSMPSPVSQKALLSSDPRMLRKQLGVPQHSVINYPLVHLPDFPNPYISAESHLQLSSELECYEGAASYSPTNPSEPASQNRPGVHGDVESIRSPLLLSLEKPSLHINTDTPTLRHPATAFSPLPVEDTTPATTTEPVMIDSPTPRQFMSARAVTMQSPVCTHATYSPEPQSPQDKLSRLIKRRVGSYLASPSVSPLSSDGQQASRVGPSSREHKRRESLPQLRTPSPFQVDIVSPFVRYRYVCDAVTSSSQYITHGTSVELLSTFPGDVVGLLRRQNHNGQAIAPRLLLLWPG
ncbi:hypothetical protein PAXRUDRAFT_512274 [Paxillus rubicundulus Ve08.2h10]|uniref:Uncharacterized protein n=1 Tax=Paxillus rubicundulus Ve08.2h10 TaxID=930991 RepID=A0A0D0DLJ6_9AGAM|nr:hypothetical protein PAXRUDRAFT_512274 [Paxillus rubicundulus Ve08.2h10]